MKEIINRDLFKFKLTIKVWVNEKYILQLTVSLLNFY